MTGPRPSLAVAALALVAGFGLPALADSGVAGEATISAPAGAETELKASASLRVTGLPVEPGRAVAEDTLLVAVDVTELEKELAEARGRQNQAQKEQRDRTTDQQVARGGTSSGGPPSRADILAQSMADRQGDAAREVPELQTRLTQAPIRAPKDGYLVRSLFEVGMTTRKRKPAAVFVPLAKTVLEVRVPAADAAPLAAARELTVASAAEPARTFRARVEGSAPDGDRTVLKLQPLDLPFLALGTPMPVTVAVAR